MSKYTLRRAGDLIKTLAEGETKVEVVRQVLAEKYMFEPYAAFKRMSNFTSSITSMDMRDFLEENGLLLTRREGYMMMRMFDTDGDGKLSYTEFLTTFLPKDDSMLRKEVTMRPTYRIMEGEKMPFEVEYAMMRVMEEELKAFNSAEKLRRELALYSDFNLSDLFKNMDLDNMGYITMDSVAEFMDMMGKPMEEAQLRAFMRKVDKDMDGKIVYSEFLEAFYSPDSDSNMMKTSMDLGSSRMSATMRMSSPKRNAMTSPKRKNYEKDEEYMDYVRKSYTSPKKDDKMKNIKMTTSEIYSPSKKLAFEEGEKYKTPTKSAMKGDDDMMRESMSASKQSPLKPKDEAEMVKMLREMVDMNREMETMKNELSMRRDFNLFNAFNILDKDRKGYATMKDLEKMMNQYNMYPTKDELYMVFKKFDTMMNGIIKFDDFSDAMTPKASEFAKLMSMREPMVLYDDEDAMDAFTAETNYMFGKLLRHMYNGEMKMEEMRLSLAKRPFFNLHDAFKTLDRSEKGYLTKEEFKEMMEDHGMFMTQKDLNGIMERYEKGFKGTGKVTYTDFIREMSPKTIIEY